LPNGILEGFTVKTRHIVKLFAFVAVMIMLPAPFGSAYAYASGTPSSWAVESISEAKSLGLPTDALLADYSKVTTRLEFCQAAINLLRVYGVDLDSVSPMPFSDTGDLDVGTAAALGIVNGTDAARNLFSPDLALSREQAATMLDRVLRVLNAGVDGTAVMWEDSAQISSWASTAASNLYNAGVMDGTASGRFVFSPKTPYTHEQSVVTLLRMWRCVNGQPEESSGVSDDMSDDTGNDANDAEEGPLIFERLH
jgi:hypothetical protein